MPITFSRDEDCTRAKEAMIAAFEERYGVALPMDYRAFLAVSGGGYPTRDWSPFEDTGDFVAHIYGLHAGDKWKRIDNAVREFEQESLEFLPVAVSNGGNYFLLRVIEPDRGAVYFWDHELEGCSPPTFGQIIRVSDSFSEWLNSLQLPKDEMG